MIPGYNHNVRHRGSVYHVQTEDSGLQNPVVATHLFLGGNVLATRRTSYSELAGRPDAEGRIRKLMQEQHKEMLRQLIRGVFDREGTASSRAYQPGQLAGSAAPPRPSTAPADRGAPAAAPPAPPSRARAASGADEPPVLARVPRPPPPSTPTVTIPEIEDEDLLSDRRLDEVILAYLADAPGTKRG
ncbi:MAG TPA: hypothetical protein VFK85_00430 [Anaeromyxobacteraceae bacterium]|nr:hypothetical protein [Anaeromyxobacteraceae bacterium]